MTILTGRMKTMLKTNKLREFLTHLHEQVKNHSIYVWGAQGQLGDTITEAWIRSRETNETNAKRAIAFWRKQVEAGFGDVLRAFDCSGLGMYWLQNVKGILRYDLSAHGLYNKCEKLTKDRLRVGDFVFKVNKDGKATHIGYVADTDLNVIEARGRDAGVVQLPLSGNTWNAFGRPPFWTEAEVAECEGRFIFTRVLKWGCVGDDVCELKKLLEKNGLGGLNVKNRNYFGSTRSKVKAFQRAKGLAVDGKAGPKTIAALGGFYTAE
nr:MAG TPA: putative peptidoglycan binding domain protein [Caudoviricetes sp.]